MSDETSGWGIVVGVILFCAICDYVKTRSWKHKMLKSTFVVRKPNREDLRSIAAVEALRPENEQWLYLRIKLRRRSLRMERWNDDCVYICINGMIRGAFILNREGFSGRIDEDRFCFINGTFYKNEQKVDGLEHRYKHEMYSSFWGKREELLILRLKDEGRDSDCIAKEVKITDKYLKSNHSLVYSVFPDSEIEYIVALSYKMLYSTLYPSSD